MAELDRHALRHKRVIEDFLCELNKKTDQYVLKGGTALMICYKLDRFSEDIDLDCKNRSKDILKHISDFSEKRGYDVRIAKDTDTVKRAFVHYGGKRPLKIETSFRRAYIADDEVNKIKGIEVYTIDRLAELKSSAYTGRDKIRDLYDVTFICNNYFDKLSENAKRSIRDALEYKGLDQFDYIVHNQKDELIDENRLAEGFLSAFDKIGLLNTVEEKENFVHENIKSYGVDKTKRSFEIEHSDDEYEY